MKNVDAILNKIQDISTFSPLVDVCPSLVVQVVENVSREITGLSGAEKKSAAVSWLISRIKLRYIPKCVQRIIFGCIVDSIVAYFNKSSGKRW